MTEELHPLADRTLVMSGGSRGIGLAIALGAAKLGADVVLTASGVTELSRYGGGDDPMWDIFLDKL